MYGFGDLTWVDEIVQDRLQEAMDSGRFDDGAINDCIEYVRYVPEDTILNTTTAGVDGGEEPASSSGGPPVWAWVLIALGILGFVVVVAYLIMKRKSQEAAAAAAVAAGEGVALAAAENTAAD